MNTFSKSEIIRNHVTNNNCNHRVLTVAGSSKGMSISSYLRNTFPRQANHNILSNDGTFSRGITPAINLKNKRQKKMVDTNPKS